jgi:hypothetical protein
MSKPTRPTWEGIPETGLGADPSPGYDEYIERCITYMDKLQADARKLRKWVLVFRKYMAPFPPGEMLQVLEDTMYLGEDTHE